MSDQKGLRFTCPDPRCGHINFLPETDILHMPESIMCFGCEKPFQPQFTPEDRRGPGIKLDTGKVPVHGELFTQFPLALMAIARHGDWGTRQPGHVRGGWKTVPEGFKRYSEALGRHVLEEGLIEDFHTIEGLEAVIHVAWNSVARLELLIREMKAKGLKVARE